MANLRHTRLLIDDLFVEMFDELQVAELLASRADPARAVDSLERLQEMTGAAIARLGGSAAAVVGQGRRAVAASTGGRGLVPPPLRALPPTGSKRRARR